MSDTYKVLGQAAPATGYIAGDLFTVAASSAHVVSGVHCCNTSGATRLVRLYARIGGAAVAVGNAIAYDVPVGAGETIILGQGSTFTATDKLTAASDLGGVTFTAFGDLVA